MHEDLIRDGSIPLNRFCESCTANWFLSAFDGCVKADGLDMNEPIHIVSPEAQSRPFWRLQALWARVRHRFL